MLVDPISISFLCLIIAKQGFTGCQISNQYSPADQFHSSLQDEFHFSTAVSPAPEFLSTTCANKSVPPILKGPFFDRPDCTD